MDSAKHLTIVKRQHYGLLIALVVQFILGAFLTTVLNFSPKSNSAAVNITFGLHMLVAIGIAIGAIARVVTAAIWKMQLPMAISGLVSIVIAFVAGLAAAGNGSSVAVFIMALGFLAAFVSYGVSLLNLHKP